MKVFNVVISLTVFLGLLTPGSPTFLLTTMLLAIKGGLIAGKISVAGLLLLLMGLLSPVGKRSIGNRLSRSTRENLLSHITTLDPLRCIQRMVCEVSSLVNATGLSDYEKFVSSLFSSDGDGERQDDNDIDKEVDEDLIKEEEEDVASTLFSSSSADSDGSFSSVNFDSDEDKKRSMKRIKRSEDDQVQKLMELLGTENKRYCTSIFDTNCEEDSREGEVLDENEKNENAMGDIEKFLGDKYPSHYSSFKTRYGHRRSKRRAPEASFKFRLAAFLGKVTGSRRKCRTFFNSCPFNADEIANMVRNLHEVLKKHPDLVKLIGSGNANPNKTATLSNATTTTSTVLTSIKDKIPSLPEISNEILTSTQVPTDFITETTKLAATIASSYPLIENYTISLRSRHPKKDASHNEIRRSRP